MDWLTSPSSGEEIPKIDWLITVLPGTKKRYGGLDLGIKSWEQPVKALRDLSKKICNIKGSLVFCPYRWPDGANFFSRSSNIQRGLKDYQQIVCNTYHGRNIETDHHVVEEALDDIVTNTRNVVIHMECDGEASWVKLLG